MSNDIKFIFATKESSNNYANLNNSNAKTETGVDVPLIEISHTYQNTNINDEEMLKVLNEEYAKQDTNEYNDNYNSTVNADFSQLGFNGTDTNKINYDENSSSYYIMPDKWTPESGDKDLSTTYNILKNIYGVNYFSDEGKEILEQLKLNNPGVFNEDGTNFNHDVPIVLAHVNPQKNDTEQKTKSVQDNINNQNINTQNNNEVPKTNEYGFQNTIADKINKSEDGSVSYIMPEKWTPEGGSRELSTAYNILQNVYGYDLYSSEGQKIYDAIKEINQGTFNDDYSFNHDMPIILPNANDVLNGTYNAAQYKPSSIKTKDGTVVNYTYDEQGNLASKLLDTRNKNGKKYEEYYEGSKFKGSIKTSYDALGNEVKEYTYNGEKKFHSGTITTKNGYDYVKTNEEQNSSPFIKHAYTYLPDGTMIRYNIEDGFINKYSKDGITKKIDDGRTRNGKIEFTKQNAMGDCWLLSGINALSYTNAGSNIIYNSISYNDNTQTASVYLKGADKTYTISYDELIEARNEQYKNTLEKDDGTDTSVKIIKFGSKYSTGDDDMILLEMAIEKALIDTKNGNINYATDKIKKRMERRVASKNDESILHAGFTDTAMYLLTGKESARKKEKSEISDAFLKFEQNNNKNIALTLSTKPELPKKYTEGLNMGANHAYAVKYVKGNIVGLVNPWDSSKVIELSKEDCMEICSIAEIIDL